MKRQKYPKGWNEKRVREVIAYYDGLSDEGRAAEIEAACQAASITMVAVPTELVPEVLKVIARRRGA